MRILMVEDEPKLSAFVKRGLTAERYAVDTLADGVRRPRIRRDLPIRPDRPGPHAARNRWAVKSCSASGGADTCVPVLVLTARDAIEDKVKLFDARGRRLPDQAFCVCRVVGALRRRCCAAARSIAPARWRSADLELDRLTQQVRRAGQPH